MSHKSQPLDADSPILVESGPGTGQSDGPVIRCKSGGFHLNGPSAAVIQVDGHTVRDMRIVGCEKAFALEGQNWNLALATPGLYMSTIDFGKTIYLSVDGDLTPLAAGPDGPGLQDSNDASPDGLSLSINGGPAEIIDCWKGHRLSIRFRYQKGAPADAAATY